MSHLWCILLLLGFVTALPVILAKTEWHQLDSYTFNNYRQEFNKHYRTPGETAMRQELFEARLAKIKEHNRDAEKTWKEGVNHLTDRTERELKRMRGYKKSITATLPRQGMEWHSLPKAEVIKLAPHVDWRDKAIVTPVKDQGACGSCWTFATAETIESYWAMATGQLPTLSEQQILDCTPNPDQCGGDGGCGGGTAELAMQQIMRMGGLSSEWTYSYQSYWGANQTCKFSKQTPPAAKIKNYVRLPANEFTPLLQAIATVGPIAISVDASAWSAYETGVFNGCNQTNPDIDHAVQLVGYGTDSQFGDYWLVRNSWSPAWGEEGYIRLKRSAQFTCGTDIHPSDGTGCKNGPPTVTVCGTCGILYDNSYPIVHNK